MRVLIVGGDMPGLLCSYVFQDAYGVDVGVIEPSALGGELVVDSLRCIRRTEAMELMLQDLDVEYSSYNVHGGILLHGVVEPYPKCLKAFDRDRVDRIRRDHYRKTRRVEPGELSAKTMSDPEASGHRSALRCDLDTLLGRLVAGSRVAKERVVGIEQGRVVFEGGRVEEYDRLVTTLPLWELSRISYFEVPQCLAMRLNVVFVEPKRDPYARWDYVHTPYTPENAIHRISPVGKSYACEVAGECDETKIVSDLNYLFKDGWLETDRKEGLRGHLLPLTEQATWPADVRPIGRFAKWDSRSTLDVVLEDAHEIARDWGLGDCQR